MSNTDQRQKAERLLALHHTGNLLILPNIWNPIGARLLEAKGFAAAATASAAISASLGYVDGEKIKFSTLMDIVGRIARSVSIPVTADIESGYSETLSELAERISEVVDRGCVGINIEDSLEEEGSLRAISEQCERIAQVRETASQQGLHLVINARIDCFLSESYPYQKAKLEEALTRAKAYAEAGADCIFPVGPGDAETIKTLRRGIRLPINIIAFSGTMPLEQMQKLGVNRVTFGPAIFRSCLKKLSDITEELARFGQYDCFGANTMTFDETQALLISEPE